MIVESTQESTFKPAPAGLHLARCYRIVDLGTQESTYEGQTKHLYKIKVFWEIHGQDEGGNALVTDKGEPLSISKDYTLSWGDKATLRIDLQAWRGKPFTEEEQKRFDLKTVLDKWCMVNVAHKPRGHGKPGVYANVVGVTPVPAIIKQSGLPKGHNKCDMFQISEPDMELFESFSKYLKENIEKSPEWRSSPFAKAGKSVKSVDTGSGFDDMGSDLPF